MTTHNKPEVVDVPDVIVDSHTSVLDRQANIQKVVIVVQRAQLEQWKRCAVVDVIFLFLEEIQWFIS